MDLGKFEIIEEVGKGGFGIVYKALDKVLNRTVALKVLHPELLINPNFILRFKHEAQLSARLDHPNILPIYEFGEFEGRFYIVMAYMPDGSLKDLLRKEGRLDKQRSYKIFEQICDGMSYAHSQKIIHRDLKPGNILFDSRGNARISDMGFAKLIHSDSSASLSASGGMVGTPSYMAPEIWRGKPANSATDVYSLACVLVEMLTGQPLFGGESTPEIFAKIFEPLQLPEDLPEEWKPVLEAALDKNQDERIQTVGEFFEQIKAVEEFVKEAEEVDPAEKTKSPEDRLEWIRELARTSIDSGADSSTESDAKRVSKTSERSQRSEGKNEEGVKSRSVESQSGYGEKPDLAESKEGKGKLGVIAGIALLAIIFGVIIYQIGKSNSPSPAPVIVEVPVTVTATNTALSPTKAATKSATKTQVPTVPVLGIGSTRIRPMDGMEQVYVPAGDFIMGSDDSDADSDEKPVRTVYLDAYWIDKYEVTTAQYKKCVDEGECEVPSANFSSYDDYPVRNVSWIDAQAYCKWANNGEDGLPTEAQWEKAARGPNGNKYPWGDQPPDNSRAHFNKDWSVGPIAVGLKPDGASLYGAEDMAGNVWEWVNDWYGNYDANVAKNPQGPASGSYRVIRGGSWYYNDRGIRAAFRYYDYPDGRSYYLGFRCFSSP